jgi:hypothetical protein
MCTLIAKKYYSTLKCQPNLKVKTIMDMAEKIFGYKESNIGKHGGQSNGPGR